MEAVETLDQLQVPVDCLWSIDRERHEGAIGQFWTMLANCQLNVGRAPEALASLHRSTAFSSVGSWTGRDNVRRLQLSALGHAQLGHGSSAAAAARGAQTLAGDDRYLSARAALVVASMAWRFPEAVGPETLMSDDEIMVIADHHSTSLAAAACLVRFQVRRTGHGKVDLSGMEQDLDRAVDYLAADPGAREIQRAQLLEGQVWWGVATCAEQDSRSALRELEAMGAPHLDRAARAAAIIDLTFGSG